jgi:membrane protein
MIGMWENSEPGMINDGLRSFCSIFDGIATTLLGGIYKVFFLVANATIVNGDVIKVFYSRIQLILGILMIFKLAMSILNIVINPDIIKDQKQGPTKMVTRIVTALVMLTLVIPINIPNAKENSLNAYINDHGILFGFLYKAQDSILSENILAKLILGTSSNNTADDMDVNNLSDVGNAMASTVLKVFIKINVKDATQPPCEDSETCENTICASEVNESQYAEENVDPQVILSHINDSCGSGSSERYAFGYTPIFGAVVMLIMALIITGFTVDIAVRAIKLAILRIVAPVPIISYINPPKQGGGAFDNWTKSLISTYADLFVRLAIVYFGLFMVQVLMNGGMDIFGSNVQGFTFTSGIAFIFIILGILVFMKQAPQFIKDVLGIKGKPMGNVGLSSMFAGTASLLGGAGLAGAGAAAMGAFGAASEAAAQGKPAPHAWASGRDLAAQLKTGDSKAKGGLINNLQDNLARRAGIRMAGKYGVSNSQLAKEKKNMYDWQDEVAIRDNMAERGWDKLTTAERAKVEQHYRQTHNATQGPLSVAQIEEMHAAGATMYANAGRSAYGKVKSNYEKASKFADTHRVATSFEEEFRPSLKDRTKRYSASRLYGVDKRGQHQSFGDMVSGNNRWQESGSNPSNNVAPNVRDEGNSVYTDNADRIMPTVGSGGTGPGDHGHGGGPRP